jgi:hypothetical protein
MAAIMKAGMPEVKLCRLAIKLAADSVYPDGF